MTSKKLEIAIQDNVICTRVGRVRVRIKQRYP